MKDNVISLIFIFTFVATVLSVSVGPRDASSKQYFDLSYLFDKETIYFPGQRQYELYMDYVNVSRGDFIYSAYSFCMGEHGGTHLDAPKHFNVNGWSVNEIPLTNLINVPAVLVDVEDEVNALEQSHDFVFDVNHIENFEKIHGPIPSRSVVLVHTGWSKYWPNKVKYLGWDNSTETLNFPGLSADAVKMLLKDRHIVGIGLDTASVDPGVSKTFSTHVLLAQEQIFSLENVANLGILIKERQENCSLRLFILPLNIVGGTGAPARILAYCE